MRRHDPLADVVDDRATEAPAEAPRAPAPPAAAVLALQRSAGNQAVVRHLARQEAPPIANSPTFVGNPTAEENENAVLPWQGDAQITLTSGTRYQLGTGDLREFDIGKGHLSTGAIPLGESDVQAELEIGSHTPLRMTGAEIEITPVVANVSAANIAEYHGNQETAKETLGIEGAAIGGYAGATLGSTPLGWALGLDPVSGAVKGAQIGGEAGAAVANRFFGDWYLDARLVSGALKAHFPLLYDPYLRLKLSALMLGKLANLEATLQSQIKVDVIPFIALANTGVRLHFHDGRLARTEMNLELEGGLEFMIDLLGALQFAISFLEIAHEREEDDKGDDDDGLLEIDLGSTEVFPIFEGLSKKISATANIEMIKASPATVGKRQLKSDAEDITDVLLGNMKQNGGPAKAVGDQVRKKRDKWEKDQKEKKDKGGGGGGGTDKDGKFHTGAKDDPIPMTWYKRPEDYPKTLHRWVGAKRQSIHAFPHRWYPPDDFEAGVDGQYWPWKGKKLQKLPETKSRGVATEWKYECDARGVDVGKLDQIDHVQDLQFGGPDSRENVWPLDKDINEAAGRLHNQEQGVWWRPPNGPLPDKQTPIYALPDGTWLVIEDVVRPPEA